MSVGQRIGSGVIEPSRKLVLQGRIRLIVAFTIVYNVIEAIIAIAAGTVASSAAAPDPEGRERVALRVIAVSFFALAAYVTVDALLSLTGLREPQHSTIGIVVAVVSLIVMPAVSWFERRTGRELGSASAIADSKQTLLCTYLSAALLTGLLLNSLLGWMWADSVAALVIALFAVREGIEAWKGDVCKVPVAALTGERQAHAHHDQHDVDDHASDRS